MSDNFDIIVAHRRAETGETETGDLLYGGLNSLFIAGMATVVTLFFATLIGLAAGENRLKSCTLRG